MPVRCEFKSNGVIIWHSGAVTGSELIQANKSIYAHKFDGLFLFQLMELSDAETFDVSSGDMRALAAMDRQHSESHSQYACAVAPTDYLFALSRQWNIQAETESFNTHVVRSKGEAIEWFKSKDIAISI